MAAEMQVLIKSLPTEEKQVYESEKLQNVPSGLKNAAHWVWRKGKAPSDKNGFLISWTDPSNWKTFAEVAEYLDPTKVDGIGFILDYDPDQEIIGIDLDCCRDPITGEISEWGQAKLTKLNSPTEISPSGCGYRLWCCGKLPADSAQFKGMDPGVLPSDMWEHIKDVKPKAKHCNSMEIYQSGRHLTVTGHRVDDYPAEMQNRQIEIDEVLKECQVNTAPNQEKKKKAEERIKEFAKTRFCGKTAGSLPFLEITRVIPVYSAGWTFRGGQFFGPHPTLGSTSGQNVVVDPAGVYCYMHHRIDAGGDAWNWLACECGAVAWEESCSGCLSDPAVIDKVKRYAIEKGYFKHSELFGIQDLDEAREATRSLAERCHTDIGCLSEPYILDALLVLQDKAPIEFGTLLGKVLSKEVKSAGITKRMINKAMANRKQECSNMLMDDRAGSVWRELNEYLDDLIKEHNLITSKDSETIYHYEHGVYLDDGEILVKEQVEKEFSENTDENLIRNALGKVRRRTYRDSALFNSQYVVNVKNGLLDLETLELKSHTPDCLSTVQLDVEYDPNATATRFVSFLNEVLDPKDIPLMEELIGWALIPDHKIHKAVMLVGYGRNGKGTLLSVLTKFLGEMNVSHVPLQAFGSDRYATADLDGKAANFGGDIPNTPLVNTADFKGATGNDVIRVQNKYGHAYDLRSKAKNWFSANELPMTRDKTDGFFERWFLILFTHHFSLQDGTADKDLETKLTTSEELSGILNIALAGLKRLKENDWKFSYNLTVDEIREMYEIISNPVVAFMTKIKEGSNSNIEVCDDGYIDRKDAYAEFGEFCQRKGIIAANQVQFNRLMREQTVIPVTDYRPWIPNGKDRPHCWSGIRKKDNEKKEDIGEGSRQTPGTSPKPEPKYV